MYIIYQLNNVLTDNQLVITAGVYKAYPTHADSSHGAVADALKTTYEESETRLVLNAIDAV
jgi:phage-related baseplate assembly protein